LHWQQQRSPLPGRLLHNLYGYQLL
jgi:hypothetical protein